MTAADLIRKLADAGIRLAVIGDKLHVEASPGAVNAELRALLVNRKADLIAELTGMRGHLLEVARSLGIPDQIALDLPDSEIAATAEQHRAITTEKGEEIGSLLLMYYLRSLAGIEPGLLGSLATRWQRLAG